MNGINVLGMSVEQVRLLLFNMPEGTIRLQVVTAGTTGSDQWLVKFGKMPKKEVLFLPITSSFHKFL